MKIEIHHREKGTWCSVNLEGGRTELGAFLPCLSATSVDGLRIHDYPDSRLPASLSGLEALESIEFARCHHFDGIPAGLHRLENLHELRFYQCADFHTLEGIEELESLHVLRVNACESFTDLNRCLADCGSLAMLDLSDNSGFVSLDISCLPQSLRLLDVRGCRSLEVPEADDSEWPAICSTNASEWPLTDDHTRLDDLSARIQKVASHHSVGGSDPGGE